MNRDLTNSHHLQYVMWDCSWSFHCYVWLPEGKHVKDSSDKFVQYGDLSSGKPLKYPWCDWLDKPYGGFLNWGDPNNWKVSKENPNLKWMMTGGYPYFKKYPYIHGFRYFNQHVHDMPIDADWRISCILGRTWSYLVVLGRSSQLVSGW